MPRLLAVLIVLIAAMASAPDAALAQAGELAFVQADGTLKLGNRTIRLYGIHIPPTGRFCRTYLRPPRCASRAVLELDRMIHGFVWCDPVHRNRDGTLSAVCRVRGKESRLGARADLAAELLRHGWAVALPGAPFEYVTLERIARAHNRGVWGFQADSITFR
ncbi:MAG: nuclease-like protein [Proteobacteria bacterium]|nr:nuclease-like protein [Pseudomonadota bacterium]